MSIYKKFVDLMVLPMVLTAALFSGEAAAVGGEKGEKKDDNVVVLKNRDTVLNPFTQSKDPMKRATINKDGSLTISSFKGETPTMMIRGIREVLVPDKEDPEDLRKAKKRKAIEYSIYHDEGGRIGKTRFYTGYMPLPDDGNIVIKTNAGMAGFESMPAEDREKVKGLEEFKGKVTIECGKGTRNIGVDVSNQLALKGVPLNRVVRQQKTGNPITLRGSSIRMKLSDFKDVDPEKCGKDGDRIVIKNKKGKVLVEADAPFNVDIIRDDGRGEKHSSFSIGGQKVPEKRKTKEALEKAVEDAGKLLKSSKDMSDSRTPDAGKRKFVGRVDVRDFSPDGRI